jgi:hypothetical protein
MAAKATVIDLDLPTMEESLTRIAAVMGEEVAQPFRLLLRSHAELQEMLRNGKTSLKRLQRMIFGATTERTSSVVGQEAKAAGEDATQITTADAKAAASAEQASGGQGGERQRRPRRRGQSHGRHGAKDYCGCSTANVPHESFHHGDHCPYCSGTLYRLKKDAALVRLTGQTPITGTVWLLERLRCNLCLEVFTAQRPEGVGDEKYDSKAVAILAYLRYGLGMAANRLAMLQKHARIPVPSTTQWKEIKRRADQIKAVPEHLIDEAAQAAVLYHDDTDAHVLTLMNKEARRAALAEDHQEHDPDRSGTFTTGIVAECDGHTIALYFTGAKHAGENLREVLTRRAPGLPPPIQMCDPLSRNMPEDLQTIVANCLAHGRRKFVDVVDLFTEEVRYVLKMLKQVYQTDAEAKERQLSPEERLRLHQEKSGPVMESLHQWLTDQVEQKKVEPNGALGRTIAYMRRHWTAFTLFLRQAGAPLDNNVAERALKLAIRHRNNSLFYKTLPGAHVGDLYMSLIQTCVLCHTDPFDYLTQLFEHHEQAAQNPGKWMPWNYRAHLTATQPAAKETPAGPPAAPDTSTRHVGAENQTTPQPAAAKAGVLRAATNDPIGAQPVLTPPAVADHSRTYPMATPTPSESTVVIGNVSLAVFIVWCLVWAMLRSGFLLATRCAARHAMLAHDGADRLQPPCRAERSALLGQPPPTEARTNPAAGIRAGPS